MTDFDHKLLQCPITREELLFVDKDEIINFVKDQEKANTIREGFINTSGTYFYPIIDEIILLLPSYALFIGQGQDIRKGMAFDKERVFKYYNQIDYEVKNGRKLYNDSPKWVDYRDVTNSYIRNSFTKAKKHLSPSGKYLLDIASGPIGFEEYLD
ncbi:MAG: hypothetical protein JXR65_08635 [Bacteroidales bacterium]|nr:hypothetical protein [Bacteroidales bacterium]